MDTFLKPLLNDAESLPFLFVGSGFSRRYLNTPTWQDLLDYIAQLTYSDSFQYIQKKNEVSKKFDKNQQYNDYMTYLCDLISEDLDKIWYTDEKFKTHREKYKELMEKETIPPIKIEIAEYVSSFKDIKNEMTDEINALKKISTHSISGVVTTNYDTLVEDIFGYETYPSQEELLFHSQYNVGETYKIHGCVKQPDTILINSRDYQLIEDKHKYLSAKLLTIFIEHPVFFIGYSIGDEDIKRVLSDIQQCLSNEQLIKIQERLFYIVWDQTVENFTESVYPITFQNGSSLEIKQIRLNDFSILYETLAENKSKYPVKVLRYMKQDMYNMVLTNDPTNRMFLAIPDEDIDVEKMKDIEFVYGFGMLERAKHGYSVVLPEEIFKDVIHNTGDFHPELLVTETFPFALLKCSGFMPIRKYTSQVDEEKFPLLVKNNLARFDSINKILGKSLRVEKQRLKSPMTFEEARDSAYFLKKFAMVDYNKDNIELLGDFLRAYIPLENFKTKNSDERKLIRIYDFIKYN